MTALPTMVIGNVSGELRFADLFPPEPPTAPMPPPFVEVSVTRFERAFSPLPPPPPPEAFESAPRPVLAPSTCRPVPPLPSAPKVAKRARVKATAPAGPDPRLPSNLAPHVFQNDGKASRTPAQRRKLMAACPCRLCALALNPPLTFAEHAALGLHQPTFSDARAVLAAFKWKARKVRKLEALPRPLTRDQSAALSALVAS